MVRRLLRLTLYATLCSYPTLCRARRSKGAERPGRWAGVIVNEDIGLRARREQGASAFCGTDVSLHAMDLPTEHAQRVQSPIEPSSVSPVNVDSHTLSN